jgi:hypothetical protein
MMKNANQSIAQTTAALGIEAAGTPGLPLSSRRNI